MDLDKLSPNALVAQYVIECRGQGSFLQYDDYQIIDEWLSNSPDVDFLLLVLSEHLPTYFSADKSGTVRKPKASLKGLRAKILKLLEEQKWRSSVK